MRKGEKKHFLGNGLSLKEETFCRNWLENKGNGTRAALLSFDVTNKELALANFDAIILQGNEFKLAKLAEMTAAVLSSEYIRKPKIRNRINELLDEYYFTDDFVKQQHFKLVAQDKDLSSKKGSIEMYYKLKGKFAPEKHEVDISNINIPKDYEKMNLEELKKLEAEVAKSIC